KAIEKHNHQYYALNEPVISDEEYDRLLKMLIELEGQFPALKVPNSPTQRVGAKIEGRLPTVRHAVRMISLDNTYSIDELRQWDARVAKGLNGKAYQYMAEFKIDGVSCSLTYEKGALRLAATRGDGETGEDVTHNAKIIHLLPLQLKAKVPPLLEVRGEVYTD